MTLTEKISLPSDILYLQRLLYLHNDVYETVFIDQNRFPVAF